MKHITTCKEITLLYVTNFLIFLLSCVMKNTMPKLTPTCKSMLCKYLTQDVFNQLKDKKTANNFTLLQAINSGVEN